MRSFKSRMVHALLFEIAALMIVSPLGSKVFNIGLSDFGQVAVISALIAMVWNYIFNLGFDHAMNRRLGHTDKTVWMRVLHSVLFELGMMSVLVPIIAWFSNISLIRAVVMGLSFSIFYMVYAFCLNWCYDLVELRRTKRVSG